MSQPKLGKILGVSGETIRAIENGHRNKGMPNQTLLTRISERLGAYWFEKKKEWVCSYPDLPYNRETYQLWKSMKFDRFGETDALANGLISLLLGVGDKQFTNLSDALFQIFHELAQIYGIPPDEEFVGMNMLTSNIWHPETPEKVGELQRQRARWEPPGGRSLLDFHYRTDPENQPPREKRPQMELPTKIYVRTWSSTPTMLKIQNPFSPPDQTNEETPSQKRTTKQVATKKVT
jgi:transcriptional regulator with XRE-family HTH domain